MQHTVGRLICLNEPSECCLNRAAFIFCWDSNVKLSMKGGGALKVIFVISPDYLETIYKLAKGYSFGIQGYGSVEAARAGLLYTNAVDILGFVYVSERMPVDKTGLVDFMHTCDSLKCAKKFLFVLKDMTNLQASVNKKMFNYLKLSYVPDVEIITDLVISRNIFGSMLIANYEPYKLKPDTPVSLSSFTTEHLQYKPLFSDYMLMCLDEVERLDTKEATLFRDAPYQEYVQSNLILAGIRSAMVDREFFEEINYNILYKSIEDEAPAQYCFYRALIGSLGGAYA